MTNWDVIIREEWRAVGPNTPDPAVASADPGPARQDSLLIVRGPKIARAANRAKPADGIGFIL